jgi:PadR family transcriptional regulator PadR
MRRLQTQHCLEMYDVPCDGRNRRYYRLTGLGRERLTALTDDWADFKERIDTILAKGEQG